MLKLAALTLALSAQPISDVRSIQTLAVFYTAQKLCGGIDMPPAVKSRVIRIARVGRTHEQVIEEVSAYSYVMLKELSDHPDLIMPFCMTVLDILEKAK